MFGIGLDDVPVVDVTHYIPLLKFFTVGSFTILVEQANFYSNLFFFAQYQYPNINNYGVP